MNNSKYKVCDSVILLADEEKEGRKKQRETHIVGNLGNGKYLVAGYGPPVMEDELRVIEKFGGC